MAKLVRCRESTKYGPVTNLNVPCDRSVVREDSIVADDAVVRDMGVGHDPVIVADARGSPILTRTAIDRATLANSIAIADMEFRGFSRILLVLWVVSYGRELKNMIVLADSSRPFHDDVCFNATSSTDFDIGTYNRVRTNCCLPVDPSVARHNGSLMDHKRFPGA
jgi:hypothetical protein